MSKQSIFNRLTTVHGFSEAGALALMGNWDCESNCEPCRVQGDFNLDRSVSRAYADRVDNGVIPANDFCHDAKGWGLAQWTWWTRKSRLLQFCRSRSISIANEEAQVDFAAKELAEEYAGLYATLRNVTMDNLYDAVSQVCKRYEQPAVNNIDDRYRAAMRILGEITFSDDAPTAPAQDSTVLDPAPVAETPTPVTTATVQVALPVLRKGCRGGAVQPLQQLLVCQNIDCGAFGADGDFGTDTDKAVRTFQGEHGLDVDGVVGGQTWRALLQI